MAPEEVSKPFRVEEVEQASPTAEDFVDEPGYGVTEKFEPESDERVEEKAQITPTNEEQVSHVLFDATTISNIADTTPENEPAEAAKDDYSQEDSKVKPEVEVEAEADLSAEEEDKDRMEEEVKTRTVKFEEPQVPKTNEEVN